MNELPEVLTNNPIIPRNIKDQKLKMRTSISNRGSDKF